MENRTGHGQLPIRILLEKSYGCIPVVIHDQPLSSSDGEKREHMTARECRNLSARGKSRHGIRPSLHPGGLRCDSVTCSDMSRILWPVV